MRVCLVGVCAVCVVVGGLVLPAAANPRRVAQHDCAITVYTSAKRRLELRQKRGEPVTDEALAAASSTRIPVPGKSWRGMMVWRDGKQRDYPFQDGKLVLAGWFNGEGDIKWAKREAVPIGFRVGTDSRGYGGTPLEQWLPVEATFFQIEITDPWHVPSERAAQERYSSMESGPAQLRRTDPQREAPPAKPGRVDPGRETPPAKPADADRGRDTPPGKPAIRGTARRNGRRGARSWAAWRAALISPRQEG